MSPLCWYFTFGILFWIASRLSICWKSADLLAFPSSRSLFLFGIQNRSRSYEKMFMLSSAEHEIFNADKYKRYQEIQFYTCSEKPKMFFSC